MNTSFPTISTSANQKIVPATLKEGGGRMSILPAGRPAAAPPPQRTDPGVKQEADCPPANFWQYCLVAY